MNTISYHLFYHNEDIVPAKEVTVFKKFLHCIAQLNDNCIVNKIQALKSMEQIPDLYVTVYATSPHDQEVIKMPFEEYSLMLIYEAVAMRGLEIPSLEGEEVVEEDVDYEEDEDYEIDPEEGIEEDEDAYEDEDEDYEDEY